MNPDGLRPEGKSGIQDRGSPPDQLKIDLKVPVIMMLQKSVFIDPQRQNSAPERWFFKQ